MRFFVLAKYYFNLLILTRVYLKINLLHIIPRIKKFNPINLIPKVLVNFI